MKTIRHTLTAEIEVKFRLSGMPADEREIANPKVAITYDFVPDLDEALFVSARLIDGDGLNPTVEQLDDWASRWLDTEGYEAACTAAQAQK